MIRTTLVISALTLAPAAGFAQDAEEGAAGPRDFRDASYMQSAEDIDVLNNDGEIIAEIEEILIDEKGHPAGFLLELGGFFGLADSEVAVPAEALEWNGAQYVSKMTAQQLEELRPWDE
jgi:hypothetical protein